MIVHLITPHGGNLVDLTIDESRAVEVRERAREWPSWDLAERQICDLELLVNGGFSPLQGFMNREDYESVCEAYYNARITPWFVFGPSIQYVANPGGVNTAKDAVVLGLRAQMTF